MLDVDSRLYIALRKIICDPLLSGIVKSFVVLRGVHRLGGVTSRSGIQRIVAAYGRDASRFRCRSSTTRLCVSPGVVTSSLAKASVWRFCLATASTGLGPSRLGLRAGRSRSCPPGSASGPDTTRWSGPRARRGCRRSRPGCDLPVAAPPRRYPRAPAVR